MRTIGFLAALLLILLAPLGVFAQTQDFSEMQKWLALKATEGGLPPGTKITLDNWRQYQQYMPLGLDVLFEGKYFWKMPPGAEIDIGPTERGLLPKNYVEAGEKYGAQTRVVHLPNGHMDIANYVAGIPFPSPQGPDKGYEILVNNWLAYVPHIYCNTPDNDGQLWFQDRFRSFTESDVDVVYRQTGYNTDPGTQRTEPAGGTWYTEWLMQETPEQAKYTQSLELFYMDQQKTLDLYVFVPALRRSLRLATTARCAPVFGSDWTNDDAKTIGFNGGIALFDAKVLAERPVIGLMHYNEDYGTFPGNWLMPIGFYKPSWGKWQVRNVYVLDVRRVPSERSGYCYGSRIMYVDKEVFYTVWNDLYDSNLRLWKVQWWAPRVRPVPGDGDVITNSVGAATYDLQNEHASYWSSANPKGIDPYFNSDTPKQYQNLVRFSTPAGMMQVMR
ncbi:MAG TPA: DUF1329 domain-containing protein [Candidatus Binataceae bacterium]|nr:DUF1329 domain-containing protein [Candidatus Binataceae bacterium]